MTGPEHATSQWSSGSSQRSKHSKRRRRSGASILALLVIGAAIGWVSNAALSDRSIAPDVRAASTGEDYLPETLRAARVPPSALPFYESYGFPGQSWFPTFMAERNRVRGERDPVLGWRNRDFDGTYYTVRDGHRISYQPKDPQLTVWYFGGSTMVGLAQRDDHTIPSEIARLAEADGIRIRSVNFGVESYNNYQETMAFADALAKGDPPDLVVFYDGVNEMSTAIERLDIGSTDPEQTYYQAPSNKERQERGTSTRTSKLSQEDRDAIVVRLMAGQYGRGARIARMLGEGAGVPVVHVWQPHLATTTRHDFEAPLLEELKVDAGTLDYVGRLYTQAMQRSGIDPIDLRGALSSADQPTFIDFEHTNERGAQIVAAALYERLHPQLEQLAR